MPRSTLSHFRHLHLVVTLQEFHVLFVLVFQEGKVKQRVLTLEQAVCQEELNALANRLNKICEGLSYSQISDLETELNPLTARIVEVVLQTIQSEDQQEYDQFYLDGWRYTRSGRSLLLQQ